MRRSRRFKTGQLCPRYPVLNTSPPSGFSARCFCAAYPRHIVLVCLIVLGSAAVLEILQLLTSDRHGHRGWPNNPVFQARKPLVPGLPAAPASSLTSEFRCGVIPVRYHYRPGQFPQVRTHRSKTGLAASFFVLNAGTARPDES
jgi:hypothetical protein